MSTDEARTAVARKRANEMLGNGRSTGQQLDRLSAYIEAAMLAETVHVTEYAALTAALGVAQVERDEARAEVDRLTSRLDSSERLMGEALVSAQADRDALSVENARLKANAIDPEAFTRIQHERDGWRSRCESRPLQSELAALRVQLDAARGELSEARQSYVKAAGERNSAEKDSAVGWAHASKRSGENHKLRARLSRWICEAPLAHRTSCLCEWCEERRAFLASTGLVGPGVATSDGEDRGADWNCPKCGKHRSVTPATMAKMYEQLGDTSCRCWEWYLEAAAKTPIGAVPAPRQEGVSPTMECCVCGWKGTADETGLGAVVNCPRCYTGKWVKSIGDHNCTAGGALEYAGRPNHGDQVKKRKRVCKCCASPATIEQKPNCTCPAWCPNGRTS